MSKKLSHIARQLLDTEVSFPEVIPDGADDRTAEVNVRLGDVLDERLPDILFESDGTPYRANQSWYGADCGPVVEEYLQVCRALRVTARTGLADQESLSQGLTTLSTIANVIAEQVEQTRAALAPNEELGEKLFSQMNPADVKNLLNEWRSDDYEWFISLRCASDALETIRHGLVELIQALERNDKGTRPR